MRLVRVEGNQRVGLDNGRHIGAILCGGHLLLPFQFTRFDEVFLRVLISSVFLKCAFKIPISFKGTPNLGLLISTRLRRMTGRL